MKKFNLSINSIIAAYLIGCILQNILAVKTFQFAGVSITTAGTLISWAVFACMDIVTELRGKKCAIKIFTIGMILNLVWNMVCKIAIMIPGDNEFVDSCYSVVLGTGWRIALASAAAFWIGNYINTSIMHLMKTHDGDERFCARAVVSTLFGQLVDNALFYIIAFAPIGLAGTIEKSWTIIIGIALFTTMIETAIEAVVSPGTKRIARMLK